MTVHGAALGAWDFRLPSAPDHGGNSVFVDHLYLFQLLIIIQNSGLHIDFSFLRFLNVLFSHTIMFYLFIFMCLLCV